MAIMVCHFSSWWFFVFFSFLFFSLTIWLDEDNFSVWPCHSLTILWYFFNFFFYSHFMVISWPFSRAFTAVLHRNTNMYSILQIFILFLVMTIKSVLMIHELIQCWQIYEVFNSASQPSWKAISKKNEPFIWLKLRQRRRTPNRNEHTIPELESSWRKGFTFFFSNWFWKPIMDDTQLSKAVYSTDQWLTCHSQSN